MPEPGAPNPDSYARMAKKEDALSKARSRLLGGLLGVLLCCPVLGQPWPAISCTAAALPQTVYAEGIAEPLPDILLTCSSDSTMAPALADILQVEVSVSLNASVTNAIGLAEGNSRTADAVLVVNGNDCATPAASGSIYGSCGAPSSDVQDPQFGRLADVNRLNWSDVALPLAADGEERGEPWVAELRIRGIRANASQLQLATGPSSAGIPVTASVAIRSDAGITVRNSVLQLANPLVGLGLGIQGEDTASACLGDELGNTIVHLREGFTSAFHTGAPATASAGASLRTRVGLEFSDVPEGISISVPSSLACYQPEFDGVAPAHRDSLTIGLVTGHSETGLGGSVTSGSTGIGPMVRITLDGGIGQVVYEVLSHAVLKVEDCHVPVRFEADSDRVANARATITAGFVPRSTVRSASSKAPIPRFVPPSSLDETRADLTACGTTLLFPFVSNQGGFDTGIVITHGSLRSLSGTQAAQPGACQLHYYGSTAVGEELLLVQHSTPLNPGQQLVFTVSGGNPVQNILGTEQYQGYLIAVCGYPGARGYAFISDGFGAIPDLGMGYIAPVVPVNSQGRRLVPREAGR